MMNQGKYWEIKWSKILKREEKYGRKSSVVKSQNLVDRIEDKVPEKVRKGLRFAFERAFLMVLEKGAIVLEKTYHKEEMAQNFEINQFALELKGNGKAAKVFSKNAKKSSFRNVAVSGVKGVTLGVVGIGLADVPVFVGMIFRGIYEISLHYGYDYQEKEEKYFILQVILGALTEGEGFFLVDGEVNGFIEKGGLVEVDEEIEEIEERELVKKVSDLLAEEVILAKFVQGIPVVGAVGGICDVIFMEKILKYVKLKYERRFVWEKLKEMG